MIKFKNLKSKIFAGYALFIVIILTQVVLSYSVNDKAQKTYEELAKEVKPKVELFNKYRNANSVLLLLLNNKTSNTKDVNLNNKIKKISNVDFPYFRSQLKKLKNEKKIVDAYGNSINSILLKTEIFEEDVKQINELLITTKDYKNPEKTLKAKEILAKATNNSLFIDHEIAILQRDYDRKSEQSFLDLSQKLNSSSRVLLFTTLTFILLGIFISLRITNNILKPIKKLIIGTNDVLKGNFKTKVEVLGNDEIADLAKTFNKMSDSLDDSFNDIYNKNKELEQFTYIASHDLLEPLLTVKGFANLLNEGYTEKFDEEGKQSLNYIKEATDRMSLLVKGLLDYGRIGRYPELKEIDCNKMLEEVKIDLANVIKNSNATLEIEKLPILNGFEVELRLLFQNLISNAIKFREPDKAPLIKISAKKENGWTFAIKDNGIGIEDKYKKRIFSIFQRLHSDSKYKGTGIGLAHCNKIIELHKGKIWLTSKLNEGSTFYFNVPNKII